MPSESEKSPTSEIKSSPVIKEAVNKKKASREWLAFVLIVVFAALLRLFQLGLESLWIDEGYSIRDAVDIGSLSMTRPLYYLLLHAWMKLGYSESWLRSLAVFFGIASVALMYMIGKRLFGHKAAVLSALFMTLSPLHINHSQEIRMYTLVTFTVLAQAILFVRFVEEGRMRYMMLSLGCGVLSFFAQPMSLPMFLVFSMLFLWNMQNRRLVATRWFSVQAVVCVGIIFLVPRLMKVMDSFTVQWSWGSPPPGILDVIRVIRDFNLWQIPKDHHYALLAGDIYGVGILCLAGYGIAAIYRRKKWQTTLTALWLLVPLAFFMGVSWLFGNVWLTRYVIYVSPAFYMLSALGILAIRKRWIKLSAFAIVLVSLVLRLGVYYAKDQRPEWRQATTYIEEYLKDGDAVAVFSSRNKPVFEYYYKGKAPFYALGPGKLNKSAVTGWTDRRISGMLSVLPGDSERIWYALYYGEDVGEYEVESYIMHKYSVLEKTDFHRIRIYLVKDNGR